MGTDSQPRRGGLRCSHGRKPVVGDKPNPYFPFFFLSPVGAIEIQSPLRGSRKKKKRGFAISAYPGLAGLRLAGALG